MGEVVDRVMLGRFVAQYDEGASGFFVDADEAQEVARQVSAALSLGERIMDQVHNDTSIPTEVATKVYAAIKRANVLPALTGGVTQADVEVMVERLLTLIETADEHGDEQAIVEEAARVRVALSYREGESETREGAMLRASQASKESKDDAT